MTDDSAPSRSGPSAPFLFVSIHDYRSRRKANVHFITRELSRRGAARFFSLGFSPLSLLKRDPRASLWSRANRVEMHEGTECYLWRTALHPFHLRSGALAGIEERAFRSYRRSLPAILDRWIAESATIILESGLPLILFDRIKQLNPRATVLCLCSDALATIGCSPVLGRELARVAPAFDGIRVPSRQLVGEFPDGCAIFFVPHGMDAAMPDAMVPSPYAAGTNLVSVGSMLFDRQFFEIAAAAFPHCTFHVIGGGRRARGLRAANLRLYGEMPFKETLAYIRHADVGIAPYDGANVSPYLKDTSMKLMQYRAFGIPAVCPTVAAGNLPGRFGYDPGNGPSIEAAIRAALAYGRFAADAPLTWMEVTDRILCPLDYPDTRLEEPPRAQPAVI